MGVRLIGVPNKTLYLRRSWALPSDSKHKEASLSTISTDSLCLRIADHEVPRCRDLTIFVRMTDDRQRTDKPIALAKVALFRWFVNMIWLYMDALLENGLTIRCCYHRVTYMHTNTLWYMLLCYYGYLRWFRAGAIRAGRNHLRYITWYMLLW
jgi:hypothetical protein